MRIEQILLSEYFGLYSTVDPELDAKFLKYMSLLGLDTATSEEMAELERVKGDLESKMVLGNDLRERMMLETIDRYLAGSRERLTPEDRTKAKERVGNTLQKIWQQIPPKSNPRRNVKDRN